MKRLMILVMALGTVAVPLAARAQNAGAPAYEKPLSAEAVRDVQARLKGLGYYGGPVDANWGLRRRAQRPVLSAAGTQRSSRRFPRLLHALNRSNPGGPGPRLRACGRNRCWIGRGASFDRPAARPSSG